jgi:putative acetyltransferase
MQAMCDYAERWMGVLRIELTVYTDNAPAIALYRKFGFVDEGRRVKQFRRANGELWDSVEMGLLL